MYVVFVKYIVIACLTAHCHDCGVETVIKNNFDKEKKKNHKSMTQPIFTTATPVGSTLSDKRLVSSHLYYKNAIFKASCLVQEWYVLSSVSTILLNKLETLANGTIGSVSPFSTK